jgi:hypothetical protein
VVKTERAEPRVPPVGWPRKFAEMDLLGCPPEFGF